MTRSVKRFFELQKKYRKTAKSIENSKKKCEAQKKRERRSENKAARKDTQSTAGNSLLPKSATRSFPAFPITADDAVTSWQGQTPNRSVTRSGICRRSSPSSPSINNIDCIVPVVALRPAALFPREFPPASAVREWPPFSDC